MNNLIYLSIIAIVAGAAGSVVFYGGLLLTLRYIPSVSRPALFALLSFFLRLCVAGGILVVIAKQGGIIPLCTAFVSFIAVRTAIVRSVESTHEPMITNMK